MDEQLNNEEIKEESKFEPLFSLSEPEIDWHEKYLYLAADIHLYLPAPHRPLFRS